MQKPKTVRMPMRWEDRLIDRVAQRGELHVERAFQRARQQHPDDALHHSVFAVESLARRLALAELCLAGKQDYRDYAELCREFAFNAG